MRLLTANTAIVCDHQLGRVDIRSSQDMVAVDGESVLVATDPERRPIRRCPNIGLTIKPCTTTLKAALGYSVWIRIDGQRVALDQLTGLTDGTPPGTVAYTVRDPGQLFVSDNFDTSTGEA